jgi:hypothetical protein
MRNCDLKKKIIWVLDNSLITDSTYSSSNSSSSDSSSSSSSSDNSVKKIKKYKSKSKRKSGIDDKPSQWEIATLRKNLFEFWIILLLFTYFLILCLIIKYCEFLE